MSNITSDILVPAAMLHDVGWSKVPERILIPKTDEEKKEAELAHIELARDIILDILGGLEYEQSEIEEIIRIVQLHKSKDPKGDNRVACMVDADNLSDTYKESFYSDVKSYDSTPQQTFDFRSKNKFFTDTARGIFKKHLEERKREIESGEAEILLSKVT